MSNAKSRRSKIEPLGSITNPPADVRRPDQRRTPSLEDVRNDAEASEEVKIREIMEMEAATGGSVRLKRRTLTDSDFAHLATIPVENFSVENVMETFGGGDYKGQVVSSRGVLVRGISFKVDYSIPSKHPKQRPDEKPSETAAIVREMLKNENSGKSAESTMIPLIIQMMESSNRRFELLLERMSKPPERPASDDITKLLLTKMLEQKATPAKEILETMQLLKRLENGGKPGDGEEADGEPKTGLDLMMHNIGKMIGPMIEGALASKFPNGGPGGLTAIGPGAEQPQQPRAAAKTVSEEKPKPEENNMLAELTNRFRTTAISAARSGKDPIEWTYSMFEFVPASYHSQIFQMANAEDWFEKIFSKDPDAAKYNDFLLDVRDAALTIAFATFTLDAATKKIAADEWAKQLVAWFTPSFHEVLLEISEDQPEFIAVFADRYEANADWLEKTRQGIVNLLQKPIAPEPAAPAASAKGPNGAPPSGS